MNLNFSNITVIGLCGRMGVGKDYLAKWMKEHIFKDALIISFADLLKYQCILNSGTVCDINSTVSIYNDYFKDKPPHVRGQLQTYGCAMRSKNSEIWISTLLVSILMHMERGVKIFLIPDVRFSNEASMIKKLDGYIVRVEAPTRTKLRTCNLSKGSINHLSETEGDLIDADITINNDINVDFDLEVQQTIHSLLDVIQEKFTNIENSE